MRFGPFYNERHSGRALQFGRLRRSDMDLLKGMAGKIMTGVVALAVVVGAITWWSMEPASRQAILAGTGRIIAWFGIVVLLPWATFFVIVPVAKRESNLAGGMLV